MLQGPEGTPAAGGTSADRADLIAPFWEAWDIIQSRYVDQPVDDVSMMRGAIRACSSSSATSTRPTWTPSNTNRPASGLSGEYEGIGAWVDTDGKFLTIVAPMPESPAEKAGIRAGDVVIAVDGEDMTGIDPSLVVQRVLGPQGTTVRLTIQREGVEKPFDVDVMRDSINIPSVESRMLENGIAYVQLQTFGEEQRATSSGRWRN